MLVQYAKWQIFSLWIIFIICSLLFGFCWVCFIALAAISWLYRSPERAPECIGAVLAPCDGMVERIFSDPETGELCVQIVSKIQHQGCICAPVNTSSLSVHNAQTGGFEMTLFFLDKPREQVSVQPSDQAALLPASQPASMKISPLWPSNKIHLLNRFYDLPAGAKVAHALAARITLRVSAYTRLLIAEKDQIKAAQAIGRIEAK